MAIQHNIADGDHWFLGEDKLLEFTIFQADELTPQDVSGWEFSWRLKRSKSDADAAALLTKTSGSGVAIAGTFNPDPTLNTQTVVVTIADSDTDALASGTAYHELKRTTDGWETVLSYGSALLQRGVHRS